MEKIILDGGKTLYFRPFVADSPLKTKKVALNTRSFTTAVLLLLQNSLPHFQESNSIYDPSRRSFIRYL
jgi:hypothetical protein